jgi:hypothetical protein
MAPIGTAHHRTPARRSATHTRANGGYKDRVLGPESDAVTAWPRQLNAEYGRRSRAAGDRMRRTRGSRPPSAAVNAATR